MAEWFSFPFSVYVCECERERESKMPSRRVPKHKELDFPSSFLVLGEGKSGGWGGGG